MIYTVVIASLMNGKITDKTATVKADSEKMAIRVACKDLRLAYPLPAGSSVKSIQESTPEITNAGKKVGKKTVPVEPEPEPPKPKPKPKAKAPAKAKPVPKEPVLEDEPAA